MGSTTMDDDHTIEFKGSPRSYRGVVRSPWWTESSSVSSSENLWRNQNRLFLLWSISDQIELVGWNGWCTRVLLEEEIEGEGRWCTGI
uniref:Predicted protein n=1 Tax=Hordeum vulgare subsp. vulgare TaxID=112509 RepID=F2EDL1_HORVV|nr:predicted protein [Hordeum vulgare subsp. vulgare]